MKQHAPAAQRNRGPILEVLREIFPERGRVLEVASGTGEHAVHFAAAFPGVAWQPTDADPAALASIAAYRAEAALDNLLEPLELDVTSASWPVSEADAVLCINMIHIAPFAACEGLFSGAARILKATSPLVTYGPYRFEGEYTAASNADFDASLRVRNPEWGVRDLTELCSCAERYGFTHVHTRALPANNHVLVFRRQ